MTAALSHRGPDGEHVWCNRDSTVMLGHRRLAIIDLSPLAAQPMHFLERYHIVHNGEIYNYLELKQELAKAGYTFETRSDTEVILAAYAHWGESCVDHFDGMFAFAIWDEQEQELFAARDRFGEKPFYFFQSKDVLLFASELKALFAAGIQRQMNLKMLFNYITIGYTDNPEIPEETFFESISRLPAASRLFYSPFDQNLEIEKYWDLNKDTLEYKISDAEAVEKFNTLFRESIRKRLRSDVSIGTSLSGGLDSSSIAATLHELNSNKLNAFTAVFPGFEKDESAHASIVANKFGSDHTTVTVTAAELVKDWDKFLSCQEEPVGSASAFAQYKVFEKAKEHGVTVLLDGQGADETLAGYFKYYKWYWQELFYKRKLFSSGEIRAARKLGVNEPFNIKNVMASLLPELASVILERQYLFNALNHEDLTHEFVKYQSREAYYTTPELSSLTGLLYFNTCIHGLGELLRYADRNSMAHGRELRLPFLNHELVEFLFSLPSNFKIRNGWTKWLLRTAMDSKLPPEIAWRRDKVGFEPPQKQWMQDPAIRERIMEARKKLVDERVLKPDVLNKPVRGTDAYVSRPDDWRYLTAAYFI